MPTKKPVTPVVREEPEEVVIRYDDLINARVKVIDASANLMYLDPMFKQGEFALRPVPKE